MQIKMQLCWNKELYRKQSTSGPLLKASNVISDTCYLEKKDLLFRVADLVLSVFQPPLIIWKHQRDLVEHNPHQDEKNHKVKVPISLQ